MGIADRINAAILGRVRSARPARGEGSDIQSFLTAERLVAAIEDGYVGDTMMLLAELSDGRVLRMNEHDARWSELLLALDAEGRAKASSTEWRLRLVGDPERNAITLI